eukprot:s352_g13.t1
MDLELDMEPLKAFIAQRIEEVEETVQSGKVAKTVDIRKVSPEIKAMMLEARTTEWEKYKSFNAAIPIWGKELQNLLDEGHKVIPSKWVETDKNEHLKGTDQQPAGGLGDPAIPAEACLLCRVPIYGSIDAGRGFYLRMDSEVKSAGMKASKVMPALYYHQDENGDLDAMLCEQGVLLTPRQTGQKANLLVTMAPSNSKLPLCADQSAETWLESS